MSKLVASVEELARAFRSARQEVEGLAKAQAGLKAAPARDRGAGAARRRPGRPGRQDKAIQEELAAIRKAVQGRSFSLAARRMGL